MAGQIAIPCILMRGGTSKGPFFRLENLPSDKSALAQVLLSAMGSPDPRQIDGLGGSDTLTSKVAIVTPSTREGVDVDYHFAQVSVDRPFVDMEPPCGNMLSGVGPFAIETGIVKAAHGVTRVVIYDVNTGGTVEALIQTPGGMVRYDGDTAIDGVPGTAAEIRLNFMNIVGGKTGSMLPTSLVKQDIQGVEVTLIDVAMPMMIVRADSVGKTGYETVAELDADSEFFKRMESIRREAGWLMGLGDVSDKVIPKMAIVAPPRRKDSALSARYFVPNKTHKAFAVTGAICVASCAALKGSVAESVAQLPEGDDRIVWIEHPSGRVDVALSTRGEGANMQVLSGGAVRTARKLMAGEVYIPDTAWPAGRN
jgi:4-oxalomesaconate tautomerase